MNIWVSFLLFTIGVVLVVKGGDVFVDSASWIAKASGIPTFIVGATIVSIATTLPEMIVSMLAAVNGKTDMAVGNAVGSVIANTGLILAIAMIFMQITAKRKDYLKQTVLLILSAVILLMSCLSGEMNRIGSIVLITIFAVFMVSNVISAKKNLSQTERIEISRKDLIVNIVKFVIGAGLIVLGSQLLIQNGSDIATFFGVPERIIALTLVAIGTSLPELVTTITAIVKKQSSLSIGNLIGANILNLTLILPLSGLVSGASLPIGQQSIVIDIPVCLGITLLAMIPMMWRQKASKLQGVLLLLGYASYLIYVL